MKLGSPDHEPDPRPRAAPVGPGSAYAPVSQARWVTPEAVRTVDAMPIAERDATPLGHWRFSADPADEGVERGWASGPRDDWRVVAIPHVWSRAEAELADYKGPCWYARSLDVPGGRRAQLRFGALDYIAHGYLDGRLAGAHEGGFTPVAFDVPDGTRSVALRVDDPPETGMLGPHPLTAAKRKVKGVFEFHDSRPGGHAEGLWFPPSVALRWGTGGMTEPAVLISTGDVRIDAAFVTATSERLELSWVLMNHASEPIAARIAAAVTDPGGDGCGGVEVDVTLPSGASRVGIAMPLTDAQAWTATTGPTHRPALYELSSEVRIADEVSDAHRTRFGVRTVEMPLEPDDQFRLHLDGEPTYVRAANYIPGVWTPELSEAIFRADLELAASANLNSLGPHAHVLPDRFYDAADEAGVLVYQDFPLNLGSDPDGAPLFDGGPTMAEASLLLAAEAAYHLYNHPSVVYWCGHNEPGYQLAEAFGPATHPDIVEIRERLEALPNDEHLDDARVELWNRVDPARPAFKASGLGRTREVGDNHTYTGSLSTDPTTAVTTVDAAFLSEFGAWTPNFSAALRAPGARGDWPPDPACVADWEYRTHIYLGTTLHAGRPERYPDFATWTYGCQLWAGMFIKVATESFRRRMWNRYAAHRYHLFVDHWGDAGAGVVDRFRTRQLHWWALADANRPLLPVVELPPSQRVVPGEDVRLGTWVVNDTRERFTDASLRWTLCRLPPDGAFVIGVDDPQVPHRFGDPKPPAGDLVVVPRTRGEPIDSGEQTLDVAANASPSGTDIAFAAPERGEYALWLELVAGGQRVENWGSFVSAPTEWEAEPGTTPMPRYSVQVAEAGPFRVERRWTGEVVGRGAGDASFELPPDQYLLVRGDSALPVDLYGDVVVDASGIEASSSLPWRFDPLGRPALLPLTTP